MKLVVRGHNLKVTPAIKSYAEKKLNKFSGYFSEIVDAVLELEVKRISDKSRAHVAKINMKLPSHVIVRAEAETADIYASIDELVSKLEHPLKKYQDKLKDNHKKIGFVSSLRRKITKDYSDLTNKIKITKEKKAAVKPMDPIEAVLQLNVSKELFYVFNNTKTSHQIGIVYDRLNGTYGLQTFRELYLRRAKLKKFKNLPSDKKYDGGGVKITKIKDIEAKEMTPADAAARLANSNSLTFMPFINLENNSINVIYKKKGNMAFGLIEPAM